jgi:Nuclease-related domain
MITHPTSRSRRLGLPLLSPGDRLAAGLGRGLPDDFHYFRNVALAGQGPIDAVVVGPGGTFVLTHTDIRGRFHRRNGHWYRWNRGTESWVPWDAVPVTAARLAARRLSLTLERAGLPAAVEAVLMPPSQTPVTWDADEHVALLVETDPGRLAAAMSRDDVLSPSQVERIVALLDPRQPIRQLAPATPGG